MFCAKCYSRLLFVCMRGWWFACVDSVIAKCILLFKKIKLLANATMKAIEDQKTYKLCCTLLLCEFMGLLTSGIDFLFD